MRKDGSRFWAHVVLDAIRNDAGQLIGFAKITRDVTERKNAERELDQAREALFQSQKMEAMGQLTGGVAHDFNNLLTVIMGGLDTIARSKPTDMVRIRRALEMSRHAADRAAGLTSRLLAFSRKQALEPTPSDLNTLVRDMADLLHRTLGEQIELESVLSPRLWTVEIDQNQLENAILNLAVNRSASVGRNISRKNLRGLRSTRAEGSPPVGVGDGKARERMGTMATPSATRAAHMSMGTRDHYAEGDLVMSQQRPAATQRTLSAALLQLSMRQKSPARGRTSGAGQRRPSEDAEFGRLSSCRNLFRRQALFGPNASRDGRTQRGRSRQPQPRGNPCRKMTIHRQVSRTRANEMRANLKLVEAEPSTVNRKVADPGSRSGAPGRPTNASLRTREYVTGAEVEKLVKAAKDGRWGDRYRV